MTIGQRIKMLREEKGYTQDELAASINTTKQTVYKYENEIVTNIPSDKIETMARYLGVTPTYLMGWEDRNDYLIEVNDNEKLLIECYRSMDSSLNERLMAYIKKLMDIQKAENETK